MKHHRHKHLGSFLEEGGQAAQSWRKATMYARTACAVAQQVKLAPATLASLIRVAVLISAAPLSIQLLAVCRVVSVLGPSPFLWQTKTEFQVPAIVVT